MQIVVVPAGCLSFALDSRYLGQDEGAFSDVFVGLSKGEVVTDLS
jgi:hypothetical protein